MVAQKVAVAVTGNSESHQWPRTGHPGRVTLAVQHLNEDAGENATSFLLVHGFTQNASCMQPFASHLESALAVQGMTAAIAMVDAPGHGASAHDHADLIDAASLLVEAGGDGHYVGYSMGGRMLLHAALLFPERMRSLTLIGATAGIDGAVDRAKRLVSDEDVAVRLERDGIESFLDFWLGLDLFATLPAEAAMREERLTNRPDGLAASLRQCGAGNQFPLWNRLSRINVPTQIIAGASDAKFTEIGRRMVELLPNARFDAVPGGHAVHSEQPEAVAALIAAFSSGRA